MGNQTVADDVTTNVTAQPQRIRSVHFRVSTRSSIADRAEMFSMPAANLPQQGVYPTRYCVLTKCTAGQVGWARIRSITTEVATTNLERDVLLMKLHIARSSPAAAAEATAPSSSSSR